MELPARPADDAPPRRPRRRRERTARARAADESAPRVMSDEVAHAPRNAPNPPLGSPAARGSEPRTSRWPPALFTGRRRGSQRDYARGPPVAALRASTRSRGRVLLLGLVHLDILGLGFVVHPADERVELSISARERRERSRLMHLAVGRDELLNTSRRRRCRFSIISSTSSSDGSTPRGGLEQLLLVLLDRAVTSASYLSNWARSCASSGPSPSLPFLGVSPPFFFFSFFAFFGLGTASTTPP